MISNFIKLINNSGSIYHSVEFIKEYLEKKGYGELNINNKFEISQGGRYYIIKSGALLAFRVDSVEEGFKIIASHLDSPALKIKSNPDIVANGYNQLNVEVYGGPILNTWYDKPLSIAGTVIYSDAGETKQTLVDFKRPICVIPNLAIHMNREINSGVKIDKQKHLLPITGINQEGIDHQDFLSLLANELKTDKENILSYDLNLYCTTEPSLFGLNEEFILSPKLDNLSMAMASIEALIESKIGKGIQVALCLDAEEVGSKTFNGGDSNFTNHLLERIGLALGMDREAYLRMLEQSFCISADLAHSIHPNHSDKADLTNRPVMNKGLVIKKSSNKKYATDPLTEARIINLAKKQNLPYQIFFNNSNETGGSTIGPLLSSNLSIKTIDIGNPILGMHSERETGGVIDYQNIIKLFTEFYGEK